MSRNIFIYVLFISIIIFYLLYVFMIDEDTKFYYKYFSTNITLGRTDGDASIEYDKLGEENSNIIYINESFHFSTISIDNTTNQFIEIKINNTQPITNQNLSISNSTIRIGTTKDGIARIFTTNTNKKISNTVQLSETTTKPMKTTTKPVVTTSKLLETSTKIFVTTIKPVVNTSKLSETTTKPVVTTSKFNGTTTRPVVTTSKLSETTTKPVVTTSKLTETTTKPVLITSNLPETINTSVTSTKIITTQIASKISKLIDITTKSPNSSHLSNSSSTECPPYPPNLIGRINVTVAPVPKLSELESEYRWVRPGGHYSPPCRQNQSLAIIIPYRNRTSQLMIFLKNMHPFLKKQQLNYTIYVIDQNDTLPFNRGELMNVGYVEALKEYNYTCFIFHDVDLFPEDDRIIYNCTDQPRHLISGLDKWGYTLIYFDLFGGVVSINSTVFKQLNGFSNRYWGWGGEDDDLRSRLRYHNIGFVRYPQEIGRYKMLVHHDEKPNPERHRLLSNNSNYFNKDGVSTVDYTVKSIDKYLLYTRVLVELKQNKIYRRKK